jgi:hypothetical protein
MSEYKLTDDQRKFLEYILSEQNNIMWIGNMTLPITRINNILKNGIYHDDKTSFEDPPKLIINKRSKYTDKARLNYIRDNFIVVIKKQKKYHDNINK